MNDYHDYVIKDGQFVGKFEEMYQDCDDPWKAQHEDFGDSSCDMTVAHITRSTRSPVLHLGSGTGRFMDWLGDAAEGVEVSKTAAKLSMAAYPFFPIYISNALSFLKLSPKPYATYLFREVLWYLLPEWAEICAILKASASGALVIVELSFYDDQQYGREYFDGPDDFVAKWPFTVERIVREHTTTAQREGRLMIAGRI